MKLKLDFHGTIFEYEKQPMPERRFKALCALAGAALYVTLVIAVMRLCGLLGLIVMAFVTGFIFAIDSI